MRRYGRIALISALIFWTGGGVALGSDPWADRVIQYVPGAGAVPSYNNATTAIGSPERFTGEGVFPSVVSVFSPPYGADEIVSLGEGGSLTVEFDEAIKDDPSNPFGIDLIIFGNAGFIYDFDKGSATTPAALLGTNPMQISLSADGSTFVSLGSFDEGFFPTQGFLDSGPFDDVPGSVPTDFTRPVDPALTLGDFDGLTLSQIRTLYAGSGGGTPIDIASSLLPGARFVRIDVLSDGNPETNLNVEIDAFSMVPEPGSITLFGVGLLTLGAAFRRG